jgi:hypothetical protein
MIAESNRIKDRLLACTSAAGIELVANEERANVKAISEQDDGKPLAHQISNMKAWRLGILARGLVD